MMGRILFELSMYLANHVLNRVPVYFIRNFVYRYIYRLSIGSHTAIQMGMKLLTKGGISIGDNCVVNAGCTLDGRGGLYIGNNVNISSEVMILTAEHAVNDPTFSGSEAPVYINDYAWVSTRAVILPGVTIGRGAVVAAGAVVSKNTPDYSIVGGVPAKFIANRSRDLSYTLDYFRLFQ